ncbi:MAG: DNA repair protein RadC [Fusobacterium sp.]|nr:DNA repair protein RadC [Fusobacterium sp.]
MSEIKFENNNGHRKRIREKFLKNGLDSLQEYEILELLLTYSIPRKDTKDLAKNLLKKYKKIENILTLNESELKNINGLGESSIVFLKLIGQLPSILYENKLKEDNILKINNKNILLKYLRSKIAFDEIERFYVLYLSNSNELIATEEKSYGTLDKSAVYPREIYKDIIKYNAKAIVLSHNHPSGNIKPSMSDIELTKEIKKGVQLFDAILLEHIIISKDSYFSFLENDLI